MLGLALVDVAETLVGLGEAFPTTFRLIIGFSRFGLLVFGARDVVFFRATLPHDGVSLLGCKLAWRRGGHAKWEEVFAGKNAGMARVGIEGRD